jgi:hypothetical protein
MGLLLKFIIMGVVAYTVWNTVRRWLGLLGGPSNTPPVTSRRSPTSPSPAPPPAAAAPAPPRGPVVEDTRACAACGVYVSVSSGKCGRPDCPQT